MAIKIYIDQGHNPRGFNTGAEGNGYREQDITYEVGKRVAALFAPNGNYQTRLSRPTADTVLGTDNTTSLATRVREANSWGANLFLSIHTNASESPAATGAEALVYASTSTVSVAIGKNILRRINAATGLRNRGIIYRPGLYVLKRTVMPAIVVELGFITNASDADLMVNAPALFAKAIYDGIIDYWGGGLC